MEGDAGSSQLNLTDADETLTDGSDAGVCCTTAPECDQASEPESLDARRGSSRLGRGWLAGISAVLVLAAGGIAAGGYFAVRSHQESQAVARNDAAAIQAAKECVAATQAPDTRTMAVSEQKIIDCGTDEFRSQALLYGSVLVQAYQAANVQVQVSDERAAVERNNADGSVDILIALRVKVSSDQVHNQENGYRLRVKMIPVDGQYKISRLDQVTK